MNLKINGEDAKRHFEKLKRKRKFRTRTKVTSTHKERSLKDWLSIKKSLGSKPVKDMSESEVQSIELRMQKFRKMS